MDVLMKRIDKINRAKTLEQSINLLSKKQLAKFAAIIAWFQVHNSFNYFLDERNCEMFLIDKCLGKRFKGTSIVSSRDVILDHVETYKIEKMTVDIIRIAKMCASGVDTKTIQMEARKMKR